MSSIPLKRSIVNQILSHAQRNPETEVCGLISSGSAGRTRLYPITNVAEEPGQLFRMAPDEQIAAMRDMRENGEELFAVYHSHPHSPAEPSPRDLAEAAYPDALFLIVSLDTKGVLQMRGFYLREGGVENVDLEVVEDE